MPLTRNLTILSSCYLRLAAGSMNANPQYVFHKASLPGVTIIEPTSPEFNSEVACVVDPAVLSDIQPVLPFSYVLKNTSDKFIILYSTRWTLTDLAGKVTTRDCNWWNLSTLRDGDAIAPGESRLVSPIFRLGVRNVGPTGSALSRQLQRTLAAFDSKTKVETRVETVIFEDGRAFGPDATTATGQAQAYLDAEREIADALGSKNAAQTLTAMAAGPRSFVMSNPAQYQESLIYYRKNFASILLPLMQSKSTDAASRLDRVRENVAQKRSLNIVRQESGSACSHSLLTVRDPN